MSIKKGIYAASMTVINKDLSINIDATINEIQLCDSENNRISKVDFMIYDNDSGKGYI